MLIIQRITRWKKQTKIPCVVVFHPNWWNKNYGIVFNEDYFLNAETRVKVEQQHRQILFDRF